MNAQIDYSNYSLSELYEAANSIDRDAYPERAQQIDALIQEKEKPSEQPLEPKQAEAIDNRASKTDRLFAAIIDSVIGLLFMLPMFFVFGVGELQEPSTSVTIGLLVYGAVLTLLVHGYWLHYYGQTLGKKFMAIRVENIEGGKASLTTIYFKRMLPMQLIGLVPAVGQLIAGLLNPLFIFRKERRCLHDYIAKTKVIYVEEPNQQASGNIEA